MPDQQSQVNEETEPDEEPGDLPPNPYVEGSVQEDFKAVEDPEGFQ